MVLVRRHSLQKAIGLLFLLYGLPSQLLAQYSFELIGSVNKAHFFYSSKNLGRFYSSYTSKPDWSFQAASNFDFAELNFRLTLGFERYNGIIKAGDGGNGGWHSTHVNTSKTLFSLGISPLEFKLKKRGLINISPVVSWLIFEKFRGSFEQQRLNYPGTYDRYQQLEDIYKRFNSTLYFGVNFRYAYHIDLKNSFKLVPQIAYYLGLTREFDEFPEQLKSTRYYIGVGLKKELVLAKQ